MRFANEFANDEAETAACFRIFYDMEGLNKTPLYLFSAVYSIIPRTPQEITSPRPTVSIIKRGSEEELHNRILK